MKKFLFEYKDYKALRSKSETETSKGKHHDEDGNKVGLQQDMGVFKWLRRERVTVTHTEVSTPPPDETQHSKSATQIGTIRTEEYKRDLAEFQARRSIGNKELPETPIGNNQLPDTPVKKKCGKNLTVSCTNCASDHDNSFNYDKKSAVKYKRKTQKRSRSATPDEAGLPNIQFLFQNQVFMPGNLFQNAPYSDPPKFRRTRHRCKRSPDIEFSAQKYIDFNEDQAQSPPERSPEIEFSSQKHIDFNEEQAQSPPLFYKNNSLPFDVKNFLEIHKSEEEVDGAKAAGDVKSSQETSPGGNDRDDRLWEVMSELKNLDKWADEQLQGHNSGKSDDSKSDTSAYGLPIASGSDLDLNMDYSREWSQGRWGVVPVQVKRLPALSVDFAKGKLCTEINILRKYRHPNIILLMGIYADVRNNVNIICETCVDTLFGVLHVQGRILTVQTAVQYALDIANALVFLRMQGYLHTELSSHCVMITAHDAAKLADLGPCERLPRARARKGRGYEVYSPEPQYVNIEDTRESNCADSEPLLSKHPSETYLTSNSVAKPYKTYRESERYRWHAPELFEEENGVVQPCCRSDVYSLCLVLWESCNAKIPFKSFTYEKLKESYISWHTGVRLPQDGTYPGCLLALLQEGLALDRSDRVDMTALQGTLQKVKRNLDKLEYIIIPARLTKKSTFSTNAWHTNSATDDSECLSPAPNMQHEAVVHRRGRGSSTESSEKDCSKSDGSALYETIRNHRSSRPTFSIPKKCYISDGDYERNEDIRPMLKYEHLPEKEFTSACSTPIAKIRTRIKDIGTPNALHRSDSTEYCSILSPERRNFGLNDDSNKDNSIERHSAKFSRSFTPKSYKPLHIKVPECNFDSVKSILKEHNGTEKPSYNFDIKNYSLPSTPIARSNKLRKNAWLSGDLSVTRRCSAEKLNDSNKTVSKQEQKKAQSAPETPADPLYSSPRKEDIDLTPKQLFENEEHSIENAYYRNSSTGLRGVDPPQDFTPETDENYQERTNSWSFKSSTDRSIKYKVEDEILASVNVKPLVAIHERWIYEANRKTGRSMSLPEDNRCQIPAVKPASHCVDTLQKSLPQLNLKRGVPKTFRPHLASPNGISWEQFCQARDTVARNVNFGSHNSERFATWKKETSKGTVTDIEEQKEPKVDQSTDTLSIEEFIRDLIRKEFQHLVHEIDDASISTVSRNEEILSKGISNVVENLRHCDDSETVKKEQMKSFSRVKINGNNKPLLQITFTRSGENSLQVLDNCVNVTICDALTGTREKANMSVEETLTGDDGHVQALKRCQAFSALQEARSTEDLYIDDDLSAQMQENFGGKVKLIPLHGSLHEILCEKEDECCLIKVKQENGCDTIYFRCDNSDTESRDAIDGATSDKTQDTVVFKRSISLVEERIQRIFPKEKRPVTPVVRRRKRAQDPLAPRPKSEVFIRTISNESRALSSSSPSLIMKGDTSKNEAVEVNIENVMSYQDSSSDECIKCHLDNDDFEILEKEIEDDLANSMVSNLTCGCLAKISEENLSVLNEDVTLKEENLI